ncbi:flagellar basal body rod C-terminal domain-containing protein [Thermodesulfatator atlanticus]
MTVSGGDGDGKLDLSSGSPLELDSISEKQIFSGLEPWVKPTQYVADLGSVAPQNLLFSGFVDVKFFDSAGNEIQKISFGTTGSPDVSVTDTNGTGAIDLEDLVSALDSRGELKAYLDNGKLFISLGDGAPQDAAYFVIEGNGPSRPWGSLQFVNDQGSLATSDDEYFELTFQMGALENWLFDEAGNPIDTDPANEVVDPFRLELSTGAGAIQIVQKYNAEENARFGLAAHLDDEGRLVVKTSGLYDTRSFVVTDAFRKNSFETSSVKPNKFDAQNNLWYLKTDESVDKNASFEAQNITIDYLKPDGTTFHTETISLTAGQTLEAFLNALNALDADSDGVSDFSAAIDDSGRLAIRVNDPDQDNDGKDDWVSFKLSTNLAAEEGNFVTYLARKTFAAKDTGIARELQGFSPAAGDNRNALRLAALSNSRREKLGQASVADFYTAIVGEVGIATKTVKNSKSFMEDLINQLKIMRDSISGVSLDEEMANLIKYQQAFSASAKILTVADEMLDTLIQAKR